MTSINEYTPTNEDLWELYNINFRSLMAQGKILERIETFDSEIFKKIRNLYYNNIPAVVLLLENDFVQGKCFERSKLLAYALRSESCEIVTAKIDGLKYNPEYIKAYEAGQVDDNYATHCYVRRKEKDGKTWVYDTSMGLKLEESLYNMMQHPEIISIEKAPKKPQSTGLREYNEAKLVEKSFYIQDTINLMKVHSIPIREEYRSILINELNQIDSKLNSYKEEKEVTYGKKM